MHWLALLEAVVKAFAVLVVAWTQRPAYPMAEPSLIERDMRRAIRRGDIGDVIEVAERRAMIERR